MCCDSVQDLFTLVRLLNTSAQQGQSRRKVPQLLVIMSIWSSKFSIMASKVKTYARQIKSSAPICSMISSVFIIKCTFLLRPDRVYSGKCGHNGSMMKWREVCSCERQNPTVSYEQFFSDLGGPAQKTHRAWFSRHLHQVESLHLLFKRGSKRQNECSEEKSCMVVDTETLPWLMLSLRRRYILCSNTL